MPMHNPAHPGQMVRSLFEDYNMTIVEAAQRLKVSRSQLSRLVGEQSGISAEMALRLEAVFGSTAEFWLRLQLAWELAQIDREEVQAGLTRAEVPKEFDTAPA